MVKEKILERLKNLRKMATQSVSPNEAANAYALLQDLLFKHNMSESELVDFEDAPVYEKEYIDLKVKTALWRVSLMNCIAKNNFCNLINTQGSYVILIGTEENREVVKFLYDTLAFDLVRICKAGVKVAKVNNPFIDGTLWNKSFYHGAVNAIATRLQAQKRQNIQEANEANPGTGTALAIKVDNALRDATASLVGATKQSKAGRGTRLDGNGFASGQQAGNNAQLNRSFTPGRVSLNA